MSNCKTVVVMPEPKAKESGKKYLAALRTVDPTIMRLHDLEHDEEGKAIAFRVSRMPLLKQER